MWVPDDAARGCMLCGRAFHIIRNRRHHCRGCGQVVCNKCSTEVRPSPPPFRCCYACAPWSLRVTVEGGPQFARRAFPVSSRSPLSTAHPYQRLPVHGLKPSRACDECAATFHGTADAGVGVGGPIAGGSSSGDGGSGDADEAPGMRRGVRAISAASRSGTWSPLPGTPRKDSVVSFMRNANAGSTRFTRDDLAGLNQALRVVDRRRSSFGVTPESTAVAESAVAAAAAEAEAEVGGGAAIDPFLSADESLLCQGCGETADDGNVLVVSTSVYHMGALHGLVIYLLLFLFFFCCGCGGYCWPLASFEERETGAPALIRPGTIVCDQAAFIATPAGKTWWWRAKAAATPTLPATTTTAAKRHRAQAFAPWLTLCCLRITPTMSGASKGPSEPRLPKWSATHRSRTSLT